MRKEKQFLPDLKDGVSLRGVMNYNIGYSNYQDNRLVPPDWAEEDLPSSEYIAAKYRNQALIALMQMPEDELHDDLDEQTIEEWALDIAQEQGESWI